MKAKLIIAALLAFAAIPAQAQDYNCNRSKYADEVTICQNRDLARLDERLNRVYNRVLRDSSYGEALRLRREQSRWLASRRSCGTREGCIRGHYIRRLGQLRG